MITEDYDAPDYDEEPVVKDIPGFSDYEIDSFGGVTSYKRDEPLRLKTGKSGPQGRYRHFILIDDEGNRITRTLHRLLAEAFVPNPEGLPVVRHLDDDPTNNSIENLAWGTVQDNANDRILNGRVRRRKVYCYEKDETYESVNQAALSLGVCPSTISSACGGYRRTAGGCHVCYADDKD